MADRACKKKWDKENVLFMTVKLFRANEKNQNDQDLIDFLDGKVRGEVVKKALREYMEHHKEE